MLGRKYLVCKVSNRVYDFSQHYMTRADKPDPKLERKYKKIAPQCCGDRSLPRKHQHLYKTEKGTEKRKTNF